MSLRPGRAQWFELLTSRDALTVTLDCLAQTRAVQLQAYSQSDTRLPLAELRATLDEYETLARRYGPWWPQPALRCFDAERAVLDAPQAALRTLRTWAMAAEPIVKELEGIAVERNENAALERLSVVAAHALPRLDRMAQAGPVLASRVYTLPPGPTTLSVPPSVLHQVWTPAPGTDGFLLAVGPHEDMQDLDATLSARKARRVALPPDLPQDPPALAAALNERRSALEQRAATARKALAHLDEAHGVAAALGELALTTWIVGHVPELPVTEHFAWITGWCADREEVLRAALDARNLQYLLRLSAPPEGVVAPSVLRNPRWARPFELVTGMMGVPGESDADPSMLVAILAPLMFGYMFGDVVQGAIVAIGGYFLARRMPVMRVLVPGGLVAILFGLAFGSVFAREDVIAPLWVSPLEHPLPVLGVAIAAGVVMITLGLALDALQHWWRGELRRWLAVDAGIVVAYLALVAGFLDVRSIWALPIGYAWSVIGGALMDTTARSRGAGHAAGEGLERLLQLSVNTVSFVRIGAFALAHCGLCAAVVGMAEAAGPAYWPVLLIGNAAIVALEGLVVSIQTTRLLLFEFFIRFVVARGRKFEPLPPPPASLTGGKPS